MYGERLIDDLVLAWCLQRVKPKRLSGKQLTSQLANKILCPYLTGVALMFTFEKIVEAANLSLKESSVQSGACVS